MRKPLLLNVRARALTVLAMTSISVWTTETLAQNEPSSPAQPPETGSPENKEPEAGPKTDEKSAEKKAAETAPPTAPKPGIDDPNPASAKVSIGPAQLPSAPSSGGVALAKDGEPLHAFSFGSYGRVISATDLRGAPGRDADLVAYGSRLDEINYAELEFRRDDYWEKTDARTRIVATLAIGNPIFHYNGNFDIKMAVRNLYIEEKGLGSRNLSVWVGSRMYRGDDIYLLNFWPLDNLNTVGGGLAYQFSPNAKIALHGGLNQPESMYFEQNVPRPAPANNWGANTVSVLDRQKFIGSAKYTQMLPREGGAGMKVSAYGEAHAVPYGQRETEPGLFEDLPPDNGFRIGLQFGAWTGQRDTHINIFARYSTGVAAYGEWGTPIGLTLDKKSDGAHELLIAAGGNYENGPFSVMLGAYFRSFRNASADLDWNDIDEGIFLVRPNLFFGELGGIAVEGSHQVHQRGVLLPPGYAPQQIPLPGAPDGALTGTVTRIGLIPFLSPAGRGSFSRPVIQVMYVVSLRNDAARAFYSQDDIFQLRKTEHYLGVGAEWWFNASYGN